MCACINSSNNRAVTLVLDILFTNVYSLRISFCYKHNINTVVIVTKHISHTWMQGWLTMCGCKLVIGLADYVSGLGPITQNHFNYNYFKISTSITITITPP